MPYLTKRRVGNPNKIEQKEAVTRHNNKWSKYYHNKQWKLLREWQITTFPLCHDCALNGRSVPAEEVHHIKPFSEGLTEDEKLMLLTDPNNVVSLCRECHDKRHGKLKNRN